MKEKTQILNKTFYNKTKLYYTIILHLQQYWILLLYTKSTFKVVTICKNVYANKNCFLVTHMLTSNYNSFKASIFVFIHEKVLFIINK